MIHRFEARRDLVNRSNHKMIVREETIMQDRNGGCLRGINDR
jgi:hypothetical protein